MKFRLSAAFLVDSTKHPWSVEGLRIGFFGMPGSGKGYTCAILVEQFLDQGGTLVIFEPRYEWETLKQKYPVQVAGGPYADVPLVSSQYRLYAEAIVKNGISIIFNTGDLEEEQLIKFAEGLIRWILKLEETTRRPLMLVIEESQEYAPRTAEGRIAPPWVYKRMVKQFKDCFTQGRKLNINPVIISQRPQELNFTIRMLCNVSFFGKFAPQDIGYIDRECLKYYRERGVPIKPDQLLDLPLGKWLVIYAGKATTIRLTTKRKTPHGAVTPKLEYTAPVSTEIQKTVSDLAKTVQQALEREAAEESEMARLKRKVKGLEKALTERDDKIKELNTALTVAGKLKIEQPVEKIDRDALERIARLTPKIRDAIDEIDSTLITVVGKRLLVEPSRPIAQTTNIENISRKEIYETWAPKIPSKAGRRILKFLLDHVDTKFTKSELAVSLGYRQSGSFNSAVSFLKRNNLVKCEGKYLWTEFS